MVSSPSFSLRWPPLVSSSTVASAAALLGPPKMVLSRRPSAPLACTQNFRWSIHVRRTRSKKDFHEACEIVCLASKRRGFGTEPAKNDKSKSTKNPKDNIRIASEPSRIVSGDPRTRNQKTPDLATGGDRKSRNVVLDQQFLEKVEAVRRSALEQKKADATKIYQAIDYDAPIESKQSTIGFGTKVGVGIAVLVFGLVFALGDFLPYGSVGPTKDATVVERKLTKKEKATLQSALEDYEATLSKSPGDPTALEGAAVTLAELGEYEKASTFLEKLNKESPNNVEAYRLLAEVKYELKDYEGSASAYRNSLSLSDSVDLEVLRGLTSSLLAAKRPDEAIQVLLSTREKLNEQNQMPPDNLADSNGNELKEKQEFDPIQVELLLGKAYSDWGHVSDAVAVYDKLINEHPNDFRGYLAKGIILKENGKAGVAERMFIQAKFFAPDAAKALVDRYAQR